MVGKDKKRWTDEKKAKQKKQWKETLMGMGGVKARVHFTKGTPGTEISLPDATAEELGLKKPLPIPARKKRRAPKPEKKRVVEQGTGDTLQEAAFDSDSDEEELVEIRKAQHREFQEKLREKIKGRCKVRVRNIPWHATEDDIRGFFRKTAGEIEEVYYPRREEDNRPKGFAVLTFPDEDGTARALTMDERCWDAWTVRVKLIAEQEAKKEARLQRQKEGWKRKRLGPKVAEPGSEDEDDGYQYDDDDEVNDSDIDTSGSEAGGKRGGKGRRKGAGKGSGRGGRKAGGRGKRVRR